MADSAVVITSGSGTNIDTRTEATSGQHRQVVVIGDPSTNAGVAPVDATNGLAVDVKALAGSITGITNSIAVHVLSTGGTINVSSTISGTVAIHSKDGTMAVYFSGGDPGVKITSGTVTGITNSIAVHVLSTGGTIQVQNLTSGTVSMSAKDGTFAVYFSPARPVVLADNQHTSSIFTVSSSVTGSYPSGKTIIAPSASYNFKVFAIAITTTAQLQNVVQLHNGGETETEFWRYALQAPTAGIAGANLAVTPPAYLFATGTSTTLAIQADASSLIHYSVSYIKESA